MTKNDGHFPSGFFRIRSFAFVLTLCTGLLGCLADAGSGTNDDTSSDVTVVTSALVNPCQHCIDVHHACYTHCQDQYEGCLNSCTSASTCYRALVTCDIGCDHRFEACADANC
jgi:hypothetical protein